MKAKRFITFLLLVLLLSAYYGLTAESVKPDFRFKKFSSTYLLQIPGLDNYTAVLTDVLEISSENEVLEFREGGDPEIVRKIPGIKKIYQYHLEAGDQFRQGFLGLAKNGGGWKYPRSQTGRFHLPDRLFGNRDSPLAFRKRLARKNLRESPDR